MCLSSRYALCHFLIIVITAASVKVDSVTFAWAQPTILDYNGHIMNKKTRQYTQTLLKKYVPDRPTRQVLADFVEDIVLSDDGEVAYNFYELPQQKRVQLFFKAYVKSGRPAIDEEKKMRQFFARWVKHEFPDVANYDLRGIVDSYTVNYEARKRQKQAAARSSGVLRRIIMVVLFIIVVIGLVAGGLLLLGGDSGGSGVDALGENAPLGGSGLLIALSVITYLWFLRQIGVFFRIVRFTVLLVVIALLIILLINGGVIELP